MTETQNYIRVIIVLYNILLISRVSYAQSWKSNPNRGSITGADNPELYQLYGEENPDEELSAKDLLIYIKDGRQNSQIPMYGSQRQELENLLKSVSHRPPIPLQDDNYKKYIEASRRAKKLPGFVSRFETTPPTFPHQFDEPSISDHDKRKFKLEKNSRFFTPVPNEVKDYTIVPPELKNKYYNLLFNYAKSLGDHFVNATDINAKKTIVAYISYAILHKELHNLFKTTYPEYPVPKEIMDVIKEAVNFYEYQKKSLGKENWNIDEIPLPKPIHQLLTLEEALNIYNLSKATFLEISQRYQSLKTIDNYTKLMKTYKILINTYNLLMSKFDELKEIEKKQISRKGMDDIFLELYKLAKWQFEYQEIIFYENLLQYLKTKNLNARKSLDNTYLKMKKKYDNYSKLHDYILKTQPRKINSNMYFPKLPQKFFGFFGNKQQLPDINEINLFQLQHDYVLMNYYDQYIKYLKSIHALRSNNGNAAKYNIVNNYETLIKLYETLYGLYVYLYGEGVIEKHENFPEPPNFYVNRRSLQEFQTDPINYYKTQLNYTLPVQSVNPINEFATASKEFKNNLEVYVYVLGKYFETNNVLFDLLETLYKKLMNSYIFYKYTYDQLPDRIRAQQQILSLPKFQIKKPDIIKIPSNIFKKPDILKEDKKQEVLRTLDIWKKQYDNDLNKYIFIFELFNFPGSKNSKVLYDYGVELIEDIKKIQSFYNSLSNVLIIHGLLKQSDIKLPQLLCKPTEDSQHNKGLYELPQLLCDVDRKPIEKDSSKEIIVTQKPPIIQTTVQPITINTIKPIAKDREIKTAERKISPERPSLLELPTKRNKSERPSLLQLPTKRNKSENWIQRKPSFEESTLEKEILEKTPPIEQSKNINIQKIKILENFSPKRPILEGSMERTVKDEAKPEKVISNNNYQLRPTPDRIDLEMTRLNSNSSKKPQLNVQTQQVLPKERSDSTRLERLVIQEKINPERKVYRKEMPVRTISEKKSLIKIIPENITTHVEHPNKVIPKPKIIQKHTQEEIIPGTLSSETKTVENIPQEKTDVKRFNYEKEITETEIPEKFVMEDLTLKIPKLRNTNITNTVLETLDRDQPEPQTTMTKTPIQEGKISEIFIEGNETLGTETPEKIIHNIPQKSVYHEAIPERKIIEKITQIGDINKTIPTERKISGKLTTETSIKKLSVPQRPAVLTPEELTVETKRYKRPSIITEQIIPEKFTTETPTAKVFIPERMNVKRVNSEKMIPFEEKVKKLQPVQEIRIQEKFIPGITQQRNITQELPIHTKIPQPRSRPNALVQESLIQQGPASVKKTSETIILQRPLLETPTPDILNLSNPKYITQERPILTKLKPKRASLKEITPQTSHLESIPQRPYPRKMIKQKAIHPETSYQSDSRNVILQKPYLKEIHQEKLKPDTLLYEKLKTIKEFIQKRPVPHKLNPVSNNLINLKETQTDEKRPKPRSKGQEIIIDTDLPSTYLNNQEAEVKTIDYLLKDYINLFKSNKFDFNKLLQEYNNLTGNYDFQLPENKTLSYDEAFQLHEKLKTIYDRYKTFYTYLILKNKIDDYLPSIPKFSMRNQNYIDVTNLKKSNMTARLLVCILKYNQNLNRYTIDEYNFREAVTLYNNDFKNYTDVLEKYKTLLLSHNKYLLLHKCIYEDNHFPKTSGLYLPNLPELYVIPPQLKKYFMNIKYNITVLPHDMLKYFEDYIITFNNMNVNFLLYKDAFNEYVQNKNLPNFIKLITAEKDYNRLNDEYSDLYNKLIELKELDFGKYVDYTVPTQFRYLHPKLSVIHEKIKSRNSNEMDYLEQKLYTYNDLLKRKIIVGTDIELWFKKYQKTPSTYYYFYLIDLIKEYIDLDKQIIDCKRNYKNLVNLPDFNLSGRSFPIVKAPWLEGCFTANQSGQNSVPNHELMPDQIMYVTKLNEYYLLKSRYEAQTCKKPKKLFINDKKLDPTYFNQNIHLRESIADKYHEIKNLYKLLRSNDLIRDDGKCNIIQINDAGVIKKQLGDDEIKTLIENYNEVKHLLSFYIKLYRLKSENFDKEILNISFDETKSVLEIIYNIHGGYFKLHILLIEHSRQLIEKIIRMPVFPVLRHQNSLNNLDSFIIRPDKYEPPNFDADNITQVDINNFLEYYTLVKELFNYYASLQKIYTDTPSDILEKVSINLSDLKTIQENLKFYFNRYEKYFNRLKKLNVLPNGEEFIPFPQTIKQQSNNNNRLPLNNNEALLNKNVPSNNTDQRISNTGTNQKVV